MQKLALVWLLSMTALAGCLGGSDSTDTDGDNGALPTYAGRGSISHVQDRALLPFDVTDERSHTLEATLNPGSAYDILEGLDVYIDITLPPTEGGSAVNPADPPRVHLGLFLPDIEGCNFDQLTGMSIDTVPLTISGGGHDGTFPDACKVPVIADAGPYYRTPGDEFATTVPLFGEGDVPAAERGSGRLGEWLISRFVPLGYAVAQISVFGTGLSNHCFDMFGYAEQMGVHESVEWMGSRGWSNGNVGLIGRSYDGSTPWMAAKHASPYLKTIVPISGLSGLGDLVTWNGASEGRIYTFQNVVYGRFGLDSNQLLLDLANHASCPDWVSATPMGLAAFATGDDVVDVPTTYWEERHFIPGAIENYDGSMLMIHGLQDSNVQPHAGWIGELALREKGNDVKGMWGQWGHMYPDRLAEHGFGSWHPDSIRMDWAQEMLEWFDHYLMGTGDKPVLGAQMQQLDGTWRVEPVWPPEDAIIRDVSLGTGTVTVGAGAAAQDIKLGALSPSQDTLLAGFSTVTLSVTPQGPGGQVSVELRDGTDNTDFGLSWGIMDLRHASPETNVVVPGSPMTIDIPIQLFDAVLPAGHELVVRISDSTQGFSGLLSTPVDVDLASSTLHASTLQRDASHSFQPPVWYYYNATGVLFQHGSTAPGADDVDEDALQTVRQAKV